MRHILAGLGSIFGLQIICHEPDTGTTSALSVGQLSATAKVTQQSPSAGGIDCVPLFAHERAGPQPDKSDGVAHDPFADSRDIDWGS